MRSSSLIAFIGAVTLGLSLPPTVYADPLPPSVISPPPSGTPTPAPHVKETSADPVTAPYPDASLAPIQVREAFTTAAKTHRRVLLDFGGNWCPDCRMLAGVFALPDVATWLEQNFIVVPINVEHFKTNMDIARHYGVSIKAVPTVLVLTPEAKLLNGDGTLALGNARRMSPQAAIDLLAQWNTHPTSTSP